MRISAPVRLIVVAFVLLLAGALLPFLMVIRVLQPSFAFSFLSYALSLVGLITGLLGIAYYGRNR